MGFGEMLNHFFNKEQIKGWTSLRKSGYILLPLIIYFIAHDIAEVLLWAVVNQIMASSKQTAELFTDNAYTVQGIINGLMILVGVFVIGGAVKSEILHGEKLVSRAKETAAHPQKVWLSEKKVTEYVVVAVFAAAAALALNLWMNMIKLTEASEGFKRAANAQYGVDFLVGLILYGIISPIAEEAVFRGVMYNRMKRCFGIGWALLISSLLFGCYHGNLVQAIYGTLLGIAMAYVYEKYESFVAPVLFHSVANISVYVMTYHNSLAEFTGVKGILAATILTVVMIICLIYVYKKGTNKEDIRKI